MFLISQVYGQELTSYSSSLLAAPPPTPSHPAITRNENKLQQVANYFGVNVLTIGRLVRRLRKTGRLTDRPRSGRPRVTSRLQDWAIRLADLRNHQNALNTVALIIDAFLKKLCEIDCMRVVILPTVRTLVRP